MSAPCARSDARWIFLGAVAGVLVLNLLLRGPRTTAAIGFMLSVLLPIAHLVPHALGSPRVARLATGLLLALGATLALQAENLANRIETLTGTVVHFPDARSRACYELLPPLEWRGRGRPYVYVLVAGEPALVRSASPVLTLEGRVLPLERAPERPTFLRAALPEDAPLGVPLRLAFGFARPSENVGLACALHYASSLPRAPSAWSADGAPPPPGAPLTPRPRGPLDRLASKAMFEQPLLPPSPGVAENTKGRYAIELWLLGPGDEVVATCY